MSLGCWWNERLLSRRAVNGQGWLDSDHAAGCARCSAARREYDRLAAGLRDLAEPTPDFRGLNAAVMARVEAVRSSPTRRAATRGLIPAACALTVLAAFLAWPRAEVKDQRGGVELTSQPTPKAQQTALAGPEVEKRADRPSGPAAKRKRSSRRSGGEGRRRRAARRIIRLAAAASLRPPAQSAKPATGLAAAEAKSTPEVAPPVSWARVGAWYEQNGNPKAALAAYYQGFREQPNPTLAYHAGRMAESTGDISTAIELYARALEPADNQEKEPERGSSTCIEERSSV